MKLGCYRRHRANGVWAARILVFVVGLLVLCLALASCGKQKKVAETKSDQDQGYSLTTEPAQSLPGKVLQKSMEPECRSNLQQIRIYINDYKNDNGGDGEDDNASSSAYPPSLASIPGLPAKILRCPVSHRDYQYDPQTGRVWCDFPGHENL